MTEQDIIAAGANKAPRITPADIEAAIAGEHYFTAAEGVIQSEAGATQAELVPLELNLLTFCVLILKNGHRIVGVNEGPVSAANFDAALGRKLARQKAVDQIWPLLGYELRSKLADDALFVAAVARCES